MLTKTLS